MKSFYQQYKNTILTVVLILLIVIFIRESNLAQFFTPENIQNIITNLGPYGPLFFIIFFTLLSMLFIPRTPFDIMGGILFGGFWGGVYISISIMIGATIEFFISRYYLKDKFERRIKHRYKKIFKYEKYMEKHEILAVIAFRSLPTFPFSAVNVAIGITDISFINYFIGTLIGSLPIVFIYTYFGSLLITAHIIIPVLYIIILIIILWGLYRLEKYIYKKVKAKIEERRKHKFIKKIKNIFHSN